MTPISVPDNLEWIMGSADSQFFSWLPRVLPLAILAIYATHSACSAMLSNKSSQLTGVLLPAASIVL